MICQACDYGEPIAEGRRIWKPEGSGAALSWRAIACCEPCYQQAINNGIKQDKIRAFQGSRHVGRTYQRALLGENSEGGKVYEQVEK